MLNLSLSGGRRRLLLSLLGGLRRGGGLRRVREDGGDELAVRRLVLFLLRVPLVEALESPAGCARGVSGVRDAGCADAVRRGEFGPPL